MSTVAIKIDMKDEPLFDDEIFDEKSELQIIVKCELDSKLFKNDICFTSQNIKCDEDFCVKEEEFDCPTDLGSSGIEVRSFSIHVNRAYSFSPQKI